MENSEHEMIQDLLNSDTIEDTTCINIIINAVGITLESDLLTELDRALVLKALFSLNQKIEKGEDIIISTK
jgi:hypothetical protein